MNIWLYALVTFLLIAVGNAYFIEINREIEKSDIPQIFVPPMKQNQSFLSVNASQQISQKIGESDKKKSSKKALLYEEESLSSSEDENLKQIQSQFTSQEKKKTQLKKHQKFVNDGSKSRLLDSKMKDNVVFIENISYFQKKENVPQIEKKLRTQKQMKHLTIYMIIGLSFFICIPIIRQVRNQSSLQSHKKNKKIGYCKHTIHFLKSDIQTQKNTFPNLSGYNKLVKQNKTQN